MTTKSLRLTENEKTLIRTLRRRAGSTEFVTAVMGATPNNVLVGLVKPTPTKPRTFATRKEIKNGGGFPCTLGCGKVLRTLDRSMVHVTTNAELQLRGHIAKS
jgi:hypothetical protein